MRSPSLNRGLRKALRTLIQLAASGALTAAVTAISGGLSPATQTLIGTGWMFIVTLLQNAGETAGIIPVLLPTASVIPVAAAVGAAVAEVAGTVEALADTAGNVTGIVSDLAGDAIGTVTGLVDPEEEK